MPPTPPPTTRARGRLPDGADSVVSLDIDGLALDCAVTVDDGAQPQGATAFGLLAASLSACTAMSVRTFLQRWHLSGVEVEVDVAVETGTPPVLHRRVGLAADVPVDLREQLAGVVDSTPVTVLLRDALVIVTRLDLGGA